jgi:outer membrane protein, multidrug efflux system
MRACIQVIHPRLVGALVSSLLVGCSLAPSYERPPAPVPEKWTDGTQGQASSDTAARLDWRSFVEDQPLGYLVDLALANNRDLRQTLLNVEAARAQYRIQRADRLPHVSLDATATRQRVGESSAAESSYQVGIGLTGFELDFFGRVRNLSEASLEEYLATERAAHSAEISLVAEVIQAFLTRDGAQHRYAIASQALEARETSLTLLAQLRARGFINELDYQEAIGLRDQVKADRERIDREFRQASNALSLLVGVSNASELLPKMHSDRLFLVQEIPPGTPSTLLLRRPDIRSAEHELKARNASIGAARAAFFPRISLTGSLGSGSPELSGLLGSGTRTWLFAPQIILPIFSGGANRANLDVAHIRKDIAVAAYEHSIQAAFREVSDALAATDTLRREEISLAEVAVASGNAMLLSEARYRGGLDDHLRFLDAQRTDYSNQIALVEVHTQRQIALSTLFRALGGGWGGEPSPNTVSVR